MPGPMYEAPCMRCGRVVRKQVRPQRGHRRTDWRCDVCAAKDLASHNLQLHAHRGPAYSAWLERMRAWVDSAS